MALRGAGLALAMAALAACSGESDSASGDASSAGDKADGGPEKIECALRGLSAFARDCAVEREGKVIVVRHPDGAFRRFEAQADGTLTVADGADEAVIATSDGVMEVSVGKDRYRFPPPRQADAPAR